MTWYEMAISIMAGLVVLFVSQHTEGGPAAEMWLECIGALLIGGPMIFKLLKII